MKTVVLRPLNEAIVVRTETDVPDPLLSVKCDLSQACGGQGLCATCHVLVKEGPEALSPITQTEAQTLELLIDSKPNSRLACQARVLGEGVVVEIPPGIYLRRAADLTPLIGRRAESPILHPRDGRVLIGRDQIITRARVLELQGEDLKVRVDGPPTTDP